MPDTFGFGPVDPPWNGSGIPIWVNGLGVPVGVGDGAVVGIGPVDPPWNGSGEDVVPLCVGEEGPVVHPGADCVGPEAVSP
jgi:hypothetical protein